MENTLKALTKNLGKKVSERTEELQISKRELEDTYNELTQIIYVTTHDLQEPVRKIHIFASALKELITDDAAIRYIDRLLSSSNRIITLIRTC